MNYYNEIKEALLNNEFVPIGKKDMKLLNNAGKNTVRVL